MGARNLLSSAMFYFNGLVLHPQLSGGYVDFMLTAFRHLFPFLEAGGTLPWNSSISLS